MKTITAKDAKNSFGSFIDSTQKEPVVITKKGRPVTISFAIQDVEELLGIRELIQGEIEAGVLQGVADMDTGRYKRLDTHFRDSLKARLRNELNNK